MLTDRRIKNLGPGVYPAGNCLYLRVGKRRRTWIVRWRRNGKDEWVVVGHYPQMSLLDARTKASEYTGVNRTFRVALEDYSKRKETSKYSVRFLERLFLPELGSKPMIAVTRADVNGILKKVIDRGKLVTANRILGAAKGFFEYCAHSGLISVSPVATMVRKHAGGMETHRTRALSQEELRRYIGVLLTDRFALQTRLALGLVLLTGQRSSEVLGLRKDEIHGVWWIIPKRRMKQVHRSRAKRVDQKVYLSPQARHLLRIAFRKFGPKPFKSNRITLSQSVKRMCKTLTPEGKPLFDPPFTPHDCRRTMVTTLGNEPHNIPPYVLEKMLYHVMAGAMGIYNLAEYLPERRKAWRIWGRVCAQLRREHQRSKERDYEVNCDRDHDTHPHRMRAILGDTAHGARHVHGVSPRGAGTGW